MSDKEFTSILTPEVIDKYQGLIFDMDGTLLNTLVAHGKAWELTGEHFGKKFDVDVMIKLTGASPRTIAQGMVEDSGLDPSLVDKVLQTKVELVDHLLVDLTEALPAYELARQYQGKKPIGIGTGTYRQFVDHLDRKFDIYQIFGREHTVTMEDVTRHKPDPETWLKVAQSLQIEPQHTLVFEDGAFGIIGALACGMDAFDVVHNRFYYARDYENIEQIKQALAQRPIFAK
ncbi:hypothetical protein CJP74_00235 [Psittacicella melopsittaci]|uniref:Uncharacterized protein n=1 Tax=Psittacicella melopsittaci TaxID=2028576 RepID=A0A3A1Y723_9GAMM|nr:HAD-IA family hydrolase [Psittacicella melopsittaci]RIY34042.1 hypothetical protein CJP74_00235 [Psittacicella melopsittaci]